MPSVRIVRTGSDSLFRRPRLGKTLRPGRRQRQCSSAAQNQSRRDEPLSAIGVASALARREREGAFTAADRDRGLKRLITDFAAWILVELTPELMVWNRGASSRSAATAIRQQSQ